MCLLWVFCFKNWSLYVLYCWGKLLYSVFIIILCFFFNIFGLNFVLIGLFFIVIFWFFVVVLFVYWDELFVLGFMLFFKLFESVNVCILFVCMLFIFGLKNDEFVFVVFIFFCIFIIVVWIFVVVVVLGVDIRFWVSSDLNRLLNWFIFVFLDFWFLELFVRVDVGGGLGGRGGWFGIFFVWLGYSIGGVSIWFCVVVYCFFCCVIELYKKLGGELFGRGGVFEIDCNIWFVVIICDWVCDEGSVCCCCCIGFCEVGNCCISFSSLEIVVVFRGRILFWLLFKFDFFCVVCWNWFNCVCIVIILFLFCCGYWFCVFFEFIRLFCWDIIVICMFELFVCWFGLNRGNCNILFVDICGKFIEYGIVCEECILFVCLLFWFWLNGILDELL